MYTVEDFDSAGDYPTRSSTTLRVLLVEDVLSDAQLTVWQLRKSGFLIRADVVDSLNDLEQAVQANPYDVVLSDFALPGFTGMDALATVKKTGVDVPFILVTGSMGENIAVECMKQGAADYVLKDHPENLTRAIQRALNEKDIKEQAGRADKELRKAQAVVDLNRELALAETALRAALDEAESASRAKSEFLSAVSHEMRTPMNAILGMADLLGELQLDSEQRQYVDVLRRAGASLLAIINNVLDLSKIESRHFELEKIDFSLEDVIERSLELGALKAREKHLVLLSRIAPGVPLNLVGDPTRLQQVLINLVGNSLKFTEKGEIVLSVNTHSSGKPGLLEFSVTDSGIGILPENLLSIFDDFIQADTSITRRYGGNGLGLGICRRLVEFMGGKISVESEPGRGSNFLFQAQFEVSAAARISAEVNDFHGRKVLVLESSSTNRMIYRETLTAWGLSTTECATAREGCSRLTEEFLRGTPYSLVILDRQLLDKDGFDAVPMIHAAQPSVPVIMLTDDSRPGEATRCRAAGVAGYAVKPVKRTDLLRLVCEALGQPVSAGQNNPAGPALPARTSVLEPLRVLIAEDSSDNRLLLRAYLKNTPHQLTFVEDGQRAVEEFRNARSKNTGFDLILMDIQMPLLDGLEATKAIRAYEVQRNLKPTPILALTASALAHDVAASSAAGCNAHLSKPISKQKLLAEIERYSRTSPSDRIPEPILVDVDPEVEELVPEYLAQRKREIAVFEDLVRHSDFDSIRVLAHNMKGNGRSFGFPALTDFGAAMELSARQCSVASLSQQLRELTSYLNRVQLKTAP